MGIWYSHRFPMQISVSVEKFNFFLSRLSSEDIWQFTLYHILLLTLCISNGKKIFPALTIEQRNKMNSNRWYKLLEKFFLNLKQFKHVYILQKHIERAKLIYIRYYVLWLVFPNNHQNFFNEKKCLTLRLETNNIVNIKIHLEIIIYDVYYKNFLD